MVRYSFPRAPKAQQDLVDFAARARIAAATREERLKRVAEQRRVVILATVRKLVCKDMLGEVSLRKVAQLAGMSTTVVFALFKDEDSLVRNAVECSLLDLAQAMAREAEPHTEPADQIRAGARACVQYAWGHPEAYAFAFLRGSSRAERRKVPRTPADPSRNPMALVQAQFARLAASGKVSGQAQDQALMTTLFWDAVQGQASRLSLARQHKGGPSSVPLAQVDALVAVLLSGLAERFAPVALAVAADPDALPVERAA
jgi:AcrR family transcriptional regulator